MGCWSIVFRRMGDLPQWFTFLTYFHHWKLSCLHEFTSWIETEHLVVLERVMIRDPNLNYWPMSMSTVSFGIFQWIWILSMWWMSCKSSGSVSLYTYNTWFYIRTVFFLWIIDEANCFLSLYKFYISSMKYFD